MTRTNPKKQEKKGTVKAPQVNGTKTVARRVEKRKLADLTPHPSQEKHFRDLPGNKLKKLAASMEKGLKHPVEVTKNNVIICGHQRVRAARLNGWTEIDVIVRDDLTDAAAVEAELLRDNRERRQLSVLQEIRALKGEYELNERNKARPAYLTGTLREVVCRETSMSGKNAQRYLDLLRTPTAVQEAFDDGKLPLNPAARVAGMKKEVQEKIAKAIKGGQDAKEVVEGYLSNSGVVNRLPLRVIWRSSIGHFGRGLKSIGPHVAEIQHVPNWVVSDLTVLKVLVTQLLGIANGEGREEDEKSDGDVKREGDGEVERMWDVEVEAKSDEEEG